MPSFQATETFFGAGEPSLVVKGDQIYLYYTYSDNEQKIYNVRLMTAAASDPNWPASMTDQGEVIDRTAFKGLNIDGCSVRYIEDQDCFQAVHGVNIADVNSYSVVWVSKDGVSGWEQKACFRTISAYAPNMPVSSATSRAILRRRLPA